MQVWLSTKPVNSLSQIHLATRHPSRWPVAFAKAALLAHTFLLLFSALTTDLHSFFQDFFPIPLGHSQAPIPLLTLNMLMIQYLWLELTKHYLGYTFFNMWALEPASSLMVQNANYLLTMAHYQPLSLSLSLSLVARGCISDL